MIQFLCCPHFLSFLVTWWGLYYLYLRQCFSHAVIKPSAAEVEKTWPICQLGQISKGTMDKAKACIRVIFGAGNYEVQIRYLDSRPLSFCRICVCTYFFTAGILFSTASFSDKAIVCVNNLPKAPMQLFEPLIDVLQNKYGTSLGKLCDVYYSAIYIASLRNCKLCCLNRLPSNLRQKCWICPLLPFFSFCKTILFDDRLVLTTETQVRLGKLSESHVKLAVVHRGHPKRMTYFWWLLPVWQYSHQSPFGNLEVLRLRLGCLLICLYPARGLLNSNLQC